MLTTERLKECASYNPTTGEFFRIQSKWGNKDFVRKSYRPNQNGYFRFCIDYKSYFVHKLAWMYMTGEYPDHEVDHINCNPSDNRWSNLRKVTAVENVRNRRLSKNNTSGHKGVTWNSTYQKWQAQVVHDRKCIYIGLFHDIEHAASAVRYKREELHGDHARHN